MLFVKVVVTVVFFQVVHAVYEDLFQIPELGGRYILHGLQHGVDYGGQSHLGGCGTSHSCAGVVVTVPLLVVMEHLPFLLPDGCSLCVYLLRWSSGSELR